MKNNSNNTNETSTDQSEAWVRQVLDFDQLSTAKHKFGLLKMSGKTVVLLWALRVYVVLMVVMIGFQIWNAIHVGA
jgi:hypothetical protein